ncbi:hypothetical protein CORMATOL_00989 [Corynebacterium matruchotii ATCC 33806]|uniref:Uncharacterized protein n=1 Tax=Corynebacterium matruchotii ATCC 33806 TaxID=566549 RepID=C0E1Y5_9CORY|nr:hypothetical protein CORMATOL_00989 [Corynebacterium matruchotii ATCC 33806]
MAAIQHVTEAYGLPAGALTSPLTPNFTLFIPDDGGCSCLPPVFARRNPALK